MKKTLCKICGSESAKDVCVGVCSFAANNYCYILPGGKYELTRSFGEIKKEYQKNQENRRNYRLKQLARRKIVGKKQV